MALPYRIREASSDDNDRLIELARRCPTRGRLAVYSDRNPDFFAMTRQQGERSKIFVGETSHGDIVGCAVLIERAEQRDGQTIKVLHLTDLRIDLSARRTKLAAQLIAKYSEQLKSGLYDHGVIEILKSNASPSRANTLLPESVEIRSESKVSVFKLLPVWNYKPSGKWTYRQATPSDFPALSRLLQSAYNSTAGAPSFSTEWLQEATQKHSSFNFANIWLAIGAQGEIAACLARWDQRALRKTVVLRPSKAVKFFVRFLALLGLLWRLPPLPQKGRALDYQYLRWLAEAPEQKGALKALIRFAMSKAREDGKCQFVLVGFHERDRLKASIRGILRLKEPMHVYSHRIKSFDQETLSPRIASRSKQALYVDLALI